MTVWRRIDSNALHHHTMLPVPNKAKSVPMDIRAFTEMPAETPSVLPYHILQCQPGTLHFGANEWLDSFAQRVE